MYIWILLATIMVALSFFNLSPRRDKDNAYNEIKTATIINRFRLENNAVVRLLQCETLMNMHTKGWDSGDAPYKIELTTTDDEGNTVSNDAFDFEYTSPAENLPVGYQADPNFQIYHYVYCLDIPAENRNPDTGAAPAIMRPCQYGSAVHPTYVVSFAVIPMRFLAKNAAAGELPEPLPMFVKYLADETKGQGIAGWLDCNAAGTCELKGNASYQVTNLINDETNEAVGNKRGVLPPNSVLFNNPDFAATCLTTQPCMFLYRKMPTTDERAYCRHRMNGWQNYLNNPPAAEGGD